MNWVPSLVRSMSERESDGKRQFSGQEQTWLPCSWQGVFLESQEMGVTMNHTRGLPT